MRRNLLRSAGVLLVTALLSALPGLLFAEEQAIELKEGMKQGDFALWLVKAIEATSELSKQNPAYTAKDAINFLTGLGAIPDPDKGWQKDEPMTKELLANLLEKPEEGANLSWDDLVEKVQKHIRMIFDKKKLGVFRVLAPTPSQPPI